MRVAFFSCWGRKRNRLTLGMPLASSSFSSLADASFCAFNAALRFLREAVFEQRLAQCRRGTGAFWF